ncbi:NACHT C-terminal alpha/beta 1 domain-containing protein [Microcoleus sp. D2_18a_D3]|uniref:NACHT C-terminal alpha/beta 1 domain-containing protein n=1 Tax=Microcoleus sp. D2_18a_D3 TaxID=3055330 RepID=UPI002FCFDADE
MPSKDKVTYGPIVKERAKRLLGALLAYANWELEDVGGISLSFRWRDETTKQPKLVIETQLRTLEFLTVKDKHEGKLTKSQIRQALNEHLEDFLHILEDNRSKTQGNETLHFTLKLWSKNTQKNLEQFEIEWERLRPEKSKQQEKTLRKTVAGKTPKSEDKLINWQEICRQNLAEQKQLTTNRFTNACGVTPQLDEIYIRLAIVERKPSKPPSRDRPEEKEEEKLIPIAEERFFEDVLRQGQSEISQGRKIAIIGEPGSGKTTRLQKIADWILKQELGLPIWVSLADLTQPTITQYIEDIWLKQTGQNLTIDALTQQKHLIWLLLDGLDEMTSKVEMRHVSALLGGWVQAARVVVTCRVNVWEADKNAFSGFDVFRNLEFNPEQVTDYIRRWFAEMRDAATGESLEAALAESENSRLKELIQNPLRLWMLCLIWQTGGGLPETQAGLYAQFVDWVYRWKADEEILDQREAIDKALARLAWAAMEQKDEVSRLRLRESWVLKVLGSRPIFEAVMKLGWLNRVERFPEAICVFYHATFQEYFAALAVKDWDDFLPRNHVDFPVPGKEYRIFEPPWKQVILLWLGRGDVADKEKFIEKLVNFDDGCGEWNFEKVDRGFYEYRAYFLAAAGIGEFNDFEEPDIISDIIDQLVLWRFGSSKFEHQEWLMYPNYIEKAAAIALKETNHLKVINALTVLLQTLPHESERVNFTVAAFILDIDPNNFAAKATITNLLNSKNYREAAESLLSNNNNHNEREQKNIIDRQEKLPEEINQMSKLLKSFEENRLQKIKALETCNDVNYLIGQFRDGFEIKNNGETSIKHTFTAAKARLAQIGREDISIIEPILQLLFTKPSHFLCRNIIDLLFEKIINSNSLYFLVIKRLKEYLDGKVIKLSFDTSRCAIEILLYCAQKLPYPEFYRAWHGLTETQTSPLVQTLNLAELPQLLQTQLTETNLHQTLQLFCIDGSKFDNPDNPAADIYLQLIKKHHCPKSTEGTPRTLTEFKIYWQLLDWDKHPILIFYQDPTSPAAQGLSPTFLDALTRFDGTICLITDTPHPPLQTFSPHDPDLLQTVVNWLKRLHLES